MRKRFGGRVAAVFLGVCVSAAIAQQTPPAANPAAAAQQGGLQSDQPPLTEQQKREQRIRALDPLDKIDTSKTPANGTTATTPDAKQPETSSANGQNHGETGDGPAVAGENGAGSSLPEYSGPAVLSRSYTVSNTDNLEPLKWTPTVSVSALYSTGLTGTSATASGVIPDVSSYGVRVAWGLSGRHLWRHDRIGVNYRGDANQYVASSEYNGTNHSLSLDYAHSFSRHLLFHVSELAALYTQGYTLSNPGLTSETSVVNQSLSASPTVQVFDNGYKQASTSVGMTWQKTARLSFDATGSYFVVSRSGNGLVGNTGSNAQGDVNYRLNRKTTVGVYYSFGSYRYSGGVQDTTTHTLGLIYSYAISRSLQLRTRFGATRLESSGLQSIPLDPVLAALVGQKYILTNTHTREVTSDISVEMAKDFGRRRTLQASFARGVSPGNGLQLTSVQQALGAGFSALVYRKYSVDAGVGRTTLSTPGQTIGSYASNYVSAGVSRSIGRGVAADLHFYYRAYDVTETISTHPQLTVSAGISWSPGERPIHF